MNKYTTSLNIVLLATLSQTTFAQVDSSVYKWVDEKKTINYTDRPAPGRVTTPNIENDIRKAAGLPVKKEKKSGYSYAPRVAKQKSRAMDPLDPGKSRHSQQKNTQASDDSQQSLVESYAKKLKAYCNQQSSNLSSLLGDTPIAWEENGKTVLLSADQRQEKIKILKSSLAKKCKAKKS